MTCSSGLRSKAASSLGNGRTRSLPSFSLYGDGRLVLPGAQIELYPGLAAARDLHPHRDRGGHPGDPGRRSSTRSKASPTRCSTWDRSGIADVPTTVITVHAGGVDRTIKAYGLSELTERPERMSEEEFRGARAKLQELVTKLAGLETWLPEGSLGPETHVRGLRAPASSWASTGRSTSPRSPSDGRSATTSIVSAIRRAGRISTVRRRRGRGLGAVREAASRANELTPWTEAGSRFSILFRPLLPDETGC